MNITANDIITFCKLEYGTEVCAIPNAVNIFYLEGCTASDMLPNPDLPDIWNDTCLIIQANQGPGWAMHRMEATSEPGLSATMSKQAAKLGGVFRIAIGYHAEKWVMGFHKRNKQHPALVQSGKIFGHRDKNRDGKRTGDLVTDNVTGLNQHGTRAGLKSVRVGEWSYACLVRRMWEDHLKFIRLCKNDPRYILDNGFKFSTTVVDYSAFWKWEAAQPA